MLCGRCCAGLQGRCLTQRAECWERVGYQEKLEVVQRDRVRICTEIRCELRSIPRGKQRLQSNGKKVVVTPTSFDNAQKKKPKTAGNDKTEATGRASFEVQTVS